MSEDRQSFFTIGQFAAIHGVTKKTLMWYDEMDLLKPDVIGENRYRYYTYRQSSVLESILMLQELNVSIDEIKAFLSERSAEGMERLLQEKITELEAHISHLKSMHQILQSRHQDMMTLLHLDLNEILIVKKEMLSIRSPFLDGRSNGKGSRNYYHRSKKTSAAPSA